jgi:hypothetical protein
MAEAAKGGTELPSDVAAVEAGVAGSPPTALGSGCGKPP